jgi:hypothetical protein
MKVFVSHAVQDLDLAASFVDLLKLGAGVSHDDIFFSSEKGSIPNGEFFVEHILRELNAADLIIALLSRSYFESKFCLAEAGAALARKTAQLAKFYSLVIPPLTFADLDAALYGRQSGSILDESALSELREILTANMPKPPKLPLWDQKRRKFLQDASDAVERWKAEQLSDQIVIAGLKLASEPAATYKLKLRIELENPSGSGFDLLRGDWDPKTYGAPLFKTVAPLPWQLMGEDGRWSEEKNKIQVPGGARFRTWISLAEHLTPEDVLDRCATKRLGSLAIRVKIQQYDEVREFDL